MSDLDGKGGMTWYLRLCPRFHRLPECPNWEDSGGIDFWEKSQQLRGNTHARTRHGARTWRVWSSSYVPGYVDGNRQGKDRPV